MNKRLYLLASLVLLSGAVSMGTIAYLQGDFKMVGSSTDPSASQVVPIELSEDGVQESSDAVQVEGESLVITAAGHYEISGQAPAVTVQVAADVADEVTITLNNASFAQLDFQSTGTNILSLAKDSTNSLSGAETGISATNVTLTGEGSLAISEVSSYGIFASDDLVVESGTLTIDSAGSGLYAFHQTEASHGNLTINGGNLTISSSQQEGAALFAGNQLTVNNGEVTVNAAYEAYVGKNLMIKGGTAQLETTANGLVSRDYFLQEGEISEANISIEGGTNTVTAGLSPVLANGNFSLTGGVNTFVTENPEQEVFTYSGSADLSGGILVALGSTSLTTSSQNLLYTSLFGNPGDTITITDAAGNEVTSYQSPVAFSAIAYSSDKLTAGEVYYLSTTSGNYGQATATLGQ